MLNTLLALITAILANTTLIQLPSPPTTLALNLAESIGATTSELKLIFDASITPTEQEAIKEAILRTGLFKIAPTEKADVTLDLSRIDSESVLAVASNSQDQRIFVKAVAWPTAALPTTLKTNPDPDKVYADRLRYLRERLAVVPIVQTYVPSPFIDFSSGWALGPKNRWALGYAGSTPVSNMPTNWAIMRGPAEVLDDRDLAELLSDKQLIQKIDQARFWPRLAWGLGFGLGAVGGIGSGVYLSQNNDRDTRTIGASLVTAGIVSGILALFYRTAGSGHVLTAAEASSLVDQHNEELRQALGLPVELAEPSMNP